MRTAAAVVLVVLGSGSAYHWFCCNSNSRRRVRKLNLECLALFYVLRDGNLVPSTVGAGDLQEQ